MLIRKLVINNFRSYYGESSFNFKEGLTLIVGGNGDGKTTFFDALYWLFDTTTDNKKHSLISEKRKSELEVGESDFVSVLLYCEHYGELIIEKKFRFEKKDNGSITTKDFSFEGFETRYNERIKVSGKILLDRYFDAEIRKYCLFKGEAELNIFNNEAALRRLVETFSDIKKLDGFVKLSEEFKKYSDIAYRRELTTNTKIAKEAKVLTDKIDELNTKIYNIKQDLNKQKDIAGDYQLRLDSLEKYQDTSEKYQDIKSRLSGKETERIRIKSLIDEEYNHKLLDDYWILASFPGIFDQYQKKISQFSKQKRRLHNEYLLEKGKEEGKKQLIDELENGATPLPWYMPDEGTMKEMIDEHICKVCNRVAEEGSAAHNFMKNKLAEYLKQEKERQKKKDEGVKHQELFQYTHIEDLHNMSIAFGGSTSKEISQIYLEIKDRFEFNDTKKNQLKKVDHEIQLLQDEKERLLIQSDGLSEEMLDRNFSNIKGFFEEKSRAENRITRLENELEELLIMKHENQDKLNDLGSGNISSELTAKIHRAFCKIYDAFENAKTYNFEQFLLGLEDRANYYLERLNIDDFHGLIRLVPTINQSANIFLYSQNDTLIENPNEALKTTMYMSVLFAISDLTTLKKEVDYPLIFDAPTSSFELVKENEFYNIIDKIDKQCIIVTKDLLKVDEKTQERVLNMDTINKLTCSVYRIEKQKPFVQTDLSTICTKATFIR